MATALRDRVDVAVAAEAPCACGSGLRHRACCGFDWRAASPAPADDPHADESATIAKAYRLGDRDQARRRAVALLEETPTHRGALATLFDLLRDDGAWEAAGKIAERVALLDPNDAMARLVAAQFFLARAELPRAQLHGRMLVRLAPEAPAAHVTMGRVFLATNNAVAAEHHFRVALTLPPARVAGMSAFEIEAALGVALRDQGRLDEARAIFTRLAEEHGGTVSLLLAWAALEEAARRFDTAAALLDQAGEKEPANRQVTIARAGLLRRTAQPEAALDTLAALPEGEDDGLLQRGQILDSIGRYDEAFAAFAAYKARLRARTGQAYRADHAERLVAALKAFFTPGRDPLLPRAAVRDDVPQPIFIVGFPRSGTTMIEQTLTRHPDIAAGDELQIVGSIAERAQLLLGSPGPYPLALSELWLGDRVGHIAMLRDLYLTEAARIGAAAPAKRWFTDKMPLNETHLGLIHLMFPQSPIVHLVRHPLDVVLSVFSNALTHGFYCAYDLDSTARHYALIEGLIAHYRAVLPLRYHAVRYEAVVEDQAREVAALADFIGVPFDPAMLDFHANARFARTASHAQVTERLYDRSRYRHRHYRTQLAPVMPVLEAAMGRLSYAVETD